MKVFLVISGFEILYFYDFDSFRPIFVEVDLNFTAFRTLLFRVEFLELRKCIFWRFLNIFGDFYTLTSKHLYFITLTHPKRGPLCKNRF